MKNERYTRGDAVEALLNGVYQKLGQICEDRECDYYNRTCDCCDYCLLTGNLRSNICPPGEACTVWKSSKKKREGPRIEYAAKQNRVERKMEERLWELYEVRRYSDKQIAIEMGMTQMAVGRWRKKYGYPNNYLHGMKGRGGQEAPQIPPWEKT